MRRKAQICHSETQSFPPLTAGYVCWKIRSFGNKQLEGEKITSDNNIMATESAFTEAGKKAGMEGWRIEDLKPVAVPAAELHKLHSGDSYIFLKTSEATTYERTTCPTCSLPNP